MEGRDMVVLRSTLCLPCRRNIHPIDADFSRCVSELFEIITVNHHPVRIPHLLYQLLPVPLDFDVLLRTADLIMRIAFNDSPEPAPAARAVFGIDECHLLASRYFHFRGGAVFGFVV